METHRQTSSDSENIGGYNVLPVRNKGDPESGPNADFHMATVQAETPDSKSEATRVLSSEAKEKKTLKKSGMRWCMLFMSCAFLMGNYFVMDNPAILELSIEQDLNIKPTQYAMFYSFYSYPNIILPLVGGIMLDKIGVRLGLILFTVLVTMG